MTKQEAEEFARRRVYSYTYGDLLDEADDRNWKSKSRSVIEKRLIKALTEEFLKNSK